MRVGNLVYNDENIVSKIESIQSKEYSEWNGDILDRKGYPAAWLQRKITDKEQDKIDLAVDKYFS